MMTGRLAITAGVTRCGRATPSRAVTATNSSSSTGVTSRPRPPAGRVTRPMSSALSCTAFTTSEVLPVAMVISSSGSLRRRLRSIGGRRKMAAVAPVPSRTRPTSPLVNRARPSSRDATAPLIRAAWSSSSLPAAVGVARRPTRSSRRTPSRFSSWPICWLIAGWVRLRWEAAAENEPSRTTSVKALT